MNGSSLHATVCCGADDRQALEQLCRCITRSPCRPRLANGRVQTNATGQAALKLNAPWKDVTTHLVMSPLEFRRWPPALVTLRRQRLLRSGQLKVVSVAEVSIREIKGSLPSEQADCGKLQVPPSGVVRGRRAHPPQSARTIALVRQARSAVHLVPSTT